MGGVSKAIGSIFGGSSDTPDVVYRDPAADEQAAKMAADTKENQERAQKKKQRRASSLLSTGGEVGSAGKQKLGG